MLLLWQCWHRWAEHQCSLIASPSHSPTTTFIRTSLHTKRLLLLATISRTITTTTTINTTTTQRNINAPYISLQNYELHTTGTQDSIFSAQWFLHWLQWSMITDAVNWNQLHSSAFKHMLVCCITRCKPAKFKFRLGRFNWRTAGGKTTSE